MVIKIPITQEYDNKTVSEDKRLVRGLENRVSECYTETGAREECVYFYIQLFM
jgi:hypothetical protein